MQAASSTWYVVVYCAAHVREVVRVGRVVATDHEHDVGRILHHLGFTASCRSCVAEQIVPKDPVVLLGVLRRPEPLDHRLLAPSCPRSPATPFASIVVWFATPILTGGRGPGRSRVRGLLAAEALPDGTPRVVM